MSTYILGWPAYIFSFAVPINSQLLLSSDFYFHGLVFAVLWSWFLAMTFARRIRRGLQSRIAAFADEIASARLSTDLFPRVEQACRDIELFVSQLDALVSRATDVRRRSSVDRDLSTQKMDDGRKRDRHRSNSLREGHQKNRRRLPPVGPQRKAS